MNTSSSDLDIQLEPLPRDHLDQPRTLESMTRLRTGKRTLDVIGASLLLILLAPLMGLIAILVRLSGPQARVPRRNYARWHSDTAARHARAAAGKRGRSSGSSACDLWVHWRWQSDFTMLGSVFKSGEMHARVYPLPPATRQSGAVVGPGPVADYPAGRGGGA